MKCRDCDVELFKSTLQGLHGETVLVNKKKGIFEVAHMSKVSCMVCPNCGLVQLYADDVKELQNPY